MPSGSLEASSSNDACNVGISEASKTGRFFKYPRCWYCSTWASFKRCRDVSVDVIEVVVGGVVVVDVGVVVEVVVVEVFEVVVGVVDVEVGVVGVVVTNGLNSCTKLITIGKVANFSGITFSSIALIIIISVSVSGKLFKINATELSPSKISKSYLPLKSSSNSYLGNTSGKSVSENRQ